MKEEFKLSEKETAMFGLGHEKATYWKKVKDVKEFIKKLKNGCGTLCGSHKYKDMNPHPCGEIVKGERRYCMDCIKWIRKIDKLAGDLK